MIFKTHVRLLQQTAVCLGITALIVGFSNLDSNVKVLANTPPSTNTRQSISRFDTAKEQQFLQSKGYRAPNSNTSNKAQVISNTYTILGSTTQTPNYTGATIAINNTYNPVNNLAFCVQNESNFYLLQTQDPQTTAFPTDATYYFELTNASPALSGNFLSIYPVNVSSYLPGTVPVEACTSNAVYELSSRVLAVEDGKTTYVFPTDPTQLMSPELYTTQPIDNQTEQLLLPDANLGTGTCTPASAEFVNLSTNSFELLDDVTCSFPVQNVASNKSLVLPEFWSAGVWVHDADAVYPQPGPDCVLSNTAFTCTVAKKYFNSNTANNSGVDLYYGPIKTASKGNLTFTEVPFQTKAYFTWYDTRSGNLAWTLIGNPNSSAIRVRVVIPNFSDTLYTIDAGKTITPLEFDLQTGPIMVMSESGQDIFTTQRAIYNGSFNEYKGVDANLLSNKYYFTWNDTLNGNSAWTLINNPSTLSANVTIKIAGQTVGTKTLAAGESWNPMFMGIQNGPVEVDSDQPVVASQRVIYNGSFNEFPGIPESSLTSKYYFTWNDTTNGNQAWTLVANPSTTTTANVSVVINGETVASKAVAPGESWTPTVPNLRGGYVVVNSDQNVIATQRVIYNGSFNEFAGIPANSLTNKYFFTWNDTKFGNHAWNLVGNPSTTQAANVTITIAGDIVGTQLIQPGETWTPEFLSMVNGFPEGIQAGPVEISSDVPVFTTQRVLYNNSFNEFSGIPVVVPV
jgi:hypothetical protein